MKVLMVCLGNICRSPLAEGILESKVLERGLSIEVDSAGTGSWHIGKAPDPRSQEIALARGLDIGHQRAQKFQTKHFDQFDYILAMDADNYADILSLSRNEGDRNKVSMILNHATPGSNQSVPDPYYGGASGFAHVYDLLDEACEAFLNKITNNG